MADDLYELSMWQTFCTLLIKSGFGFAQCSELWFKSVLQGMRDDASNTYLLISAAFCPAENNDISLGQIVQ